MFSPRGSEATAGTERDAVQLVKSGAAVILKDSENPFVNDPDGEAELLQLIDSLPDKDKT